MSAKKTDFIVNDLISKIYQQHFFNNKLPTQRDLAVAYDVSRFTIQKAIERLCSIGLVYTIQGDGIYIREGALLNPLVYNSITAVSYRDIKSKMLYLKKRKATTELCQIFNLTPDDEIWEFQRVRLVRFELTQVETGYLPCRLFPDFNQAAIEDSIQNYVIRKKYKISHFMTSYQATALTKEESDSLNAKKGTPAMSIQSRGLLKNGTIFIYSRIVAIQYECTYVVPFNKDVYKTRRTMK